MKVQIGKTLGGEFYFFLLDGSGQYLHETLSSAVVAVIESGNSACF